MELALKLYDKTLGSQRKLTCELKLVSERISARELIGKRIDAEAAEIEKQLISGEIGSTTNRAATSYLVVPGFIETILNGGRNYGVARKTNHSLPKRVNTVLQKHTACEAFQKNQFLILFDDRQVTALDDQLTVTESSAATFIKLIPLVGG